MLSPIYQGTASSPRLNHVVASIYRFTEMHQSTPSRDTELHSLPPRFTVSSAYRGGGGGGRHCTHTRAHTHACAHTARER